MAYKTESQKMAMASTQFATKISVDEYARQAVEYTTEMVEKLNQDVRMEPSIGAKSSFFQQPNNVKKGLPVFQGKHTRFVYDEEDQEHVGAVDVTHEPTHGPHVRTVADLSSDEEEDADDDEELFNADDEDDGDEQAQEDDGENVFYPEEATTSIQDEQVQSLLHDVEMELADTTIA